MYDAILLPMDGRAIAEHAASHELYDATVHIVHVIGTSLRDRIPFSEGDHKQQQHGWRPPLDG